MNLEHAKWAGLLRGLPAAYSYSSSLPYHTYSIETHATAVENTQPSLNLKKSAAAPSSVCLEQSKTKRE
jgi:hypothetical protein